MAGGVGSRFWPYSRNHRPKQFLDFFGTGRSLLQQTVDRFRPIVPIENVLIVTNVLYRDLILEQIPDMRPEQILCEPARRNTAPCIAYAVSHISGKTDKANIVVAASDHLIMQEREFQRVISTGLDFVEKNDVLLTLGMKPTRPETGYGYIEANGEDVKRFVEKPDLETAKKYVASGRFFWNSGIFCFKASTFLDELSTYSPDILTAAKIAFANAKKENKDALVRVDHEDMMNIPSNSIDYAVMEKSAKVKVVPSDIGWSDLGAFDSLYGEFDHDENGNNINAKHLGIGSKNSLVLGGQRQICTIDLDNMLIVDTPDALLVAPLASSQKVKKVVDELKARGSDLPKVPQTVNRPWGTYSVLESTDRYKMKRIVVRPGERLSLQKHLHRSEHWVVVSGTATCTVGDKVFYVRPNESTYIPSGTIHRLQNEGKLPLVIVEVQVGEYTGEDDIIRVQDDYKRS
jgi:mannose-1-phosphate guanylyltransferase